MVEAKKIKLKIHDSDATANTDQNKKNVACVRHQTRACRNTGVAPLPF